MLSLQHAYARVMHDRLFVPVILHGSNTVLWKDKERYMIRATEVGNLKNLLGLRKIDRMPNTRVSDVGFEKWGNVWLGYVRLD